MFPTARGAAASPIKASRPSERSKSRREWRTFRGKNVFKHERRKGGYSNVRVVKKQRHPHEVIAFAEVHYRRTAAFG